MDNLKIMVSAINLKQIETNNYLVHGNQNEG